MEDELEHAAKYRPICFIVYAVLDGSVCYLSAFYAHLMPSRPFGRAKIAVLYDMGV
jgi:hypothetical protein